MKLWMIRATSMVLLWTCALQLTALTETWGPRFFKSWPSCFFPEPEPAFGLHSSPLKPKRVYKNNGYLIVSCNGGLSQMRAAVAHFDRMGKPSKRLVIPDRPKEDDYFYANPCRLARKH
ncbi:hypothetical protein SASPL_124999 [Salvia splendens]|uniref:Secreted protein n=1 Tax=Salvia splendens TaxID=180675 RepID=A0A8X8XI14_SALSN|nr:hypothetical protein SASPL_124999 [Salvia splendens]